MRTSAIKFTHHNMKTHGAVEVYNYHIIRRSVFYLKHVSETGFCLRLQVGHTLVTVILIYHHHKPIDSINLLAS
jgi:hypothetical protein